MFKFLRRNKQQPEQAPNPQEGATEDHAVYHLEEVLNPLFEAINPASPEEYAGMYINVN